MKERILAEAERLFWKYGAKSVTMEDIIKPLGISKKTVYQYFIDKEDILYQVVESRIGKDAEQMCFASAAAPNPIAEMLLFLKELQQHTEQVSPNLLIDIRRHYPRTWQLFEEHKHNFIVRSILENIQKGMAQGLYRSDLNADLLSRMRVEQVELAFDNDVFPADRYSMLDVQRELIHHFVRGMLTEQGFKVYNQFVSNEQMNESNLIVYETK